MQCSHSNRCPTHDLFLSSRSTAVGGRECGGTDLSVPRELVVLTDRADGEGEGAHSVAVAVAAVPIPPSIAGSPHKDGAQTMATL